MSAPQKPPLKLGHLEQSVLRYLKQNYPSMYRSLEKKGELEKHANEKARRYRQKVGELVEKGASLDQAWELANDILYPNLDW